MDAAAATQFEEYKRQKPDPPQIGQVPQADPDSKKDSLGPPFRHEDGQKGVAWPADRPGH